VEVPAREVDIYRLDLLARTHDTLTLHIECGSGTYVRSLAVDIGEDLGCGAHVTALRRLWVEPFREPQMVTMDALEQAATQGDQTVLTLLLPISAGLSDVPSVSLDDAQSMAISRGQKIQLDPAPPAGPCAAYASDGALLALLEVDGEGFTRIVRGFNLPPN
jgi:tRNA pseudouridine55 synthase